MRSLSSLEHLPHHFKSTSISIEYPATLYHGLQNKFYPMAFPHISFSLTFTFGSPPLHPPIQITSTLLLSHQYTAQIGSHHQDTIRLIVARSRSLLLGFPNLLALEDQIRDDAEQVCDSIGQVVVAGHAPRSVVIEGVTVLMEMSAMLVDREARMWDVSQEVKLRAMEILFARRLRWDIREDGSGRIQPM